MKKSIFIRHLCLPAFLAIGFSAVPADALCQTAGVTSYTDPLAAGYVYRASNMLKTGNPLGTLDQLAASSDAKCPVPSALSAERLALEGAALFERNDPACIEVLSRLTDEYPASSCATQALLTLGDWHWYRQEWHEALSRFNQVKISALADCQRHLYTYRKALALLKSGMAEEAAPLFDSLKYAPGFALAADYYSAYILYLNGDYGNAYSMMSDIARNHPDTPDGIRPLYYMAQMEYLRGRYDDVIEHSRKIIAGGEEEELLPEIYRIAGLSLFKTGDLSQARRYLEEFVGKSGAPNDDAIYALAAAEYADGDTGKARDRFRSLTDRNNMLAQSAYLYLGQIAEGEGDLNEAAMAFRKAASMAFDSGVAETAMYNYIVANSKGGNVPFARSIEMHEEFLRKYPSSAYASDVEESLATAFFHDNDYAGALRAISRVKNPSAATLATRQKILYKLGVGEISSGELRSAAAHLREAASMKGPDATLAAEASLWLGEALFRSDDFSGAAAAYTKALQGDLSSANRTAARYGLAYSEFKLSRWAEARRNFAAVAEDSAAPSGIRGDALIREADCLLYLRQYALSAEKYRKAIDDNAGDTDYAAFRHAVVTGVTDGSDRKMKLIDAFIRDRENSRWLPEVLLEAARTWTSLERPEKAAPYYDRLIEVRPDSPQVAEALYNKAEMLESSHDRSGALEAYLALEQRGGKDYETVAVAGVMRNTSDIDQRTDYARRLLALGGVDAADAEDARLYESIGALRRGNPEEGVSALEQLAANPDNISGAMAAVELGEWYLEKGESAKALEVLERFTDAGSIHAYWLARGFIALADAYHAEGNDYLAAEYLKSLRENYPGDEADILEAIDAKIKKYSK